MNNLFLSDDVRQNLYISASFETEQSHFQTTNFDSSMDNMGVDIGGCAGTAGTVGTLFGTFGTAGTYGSYGGK